MQVVILGGSGLIGRRLSEFLLKNGYEVIVLSRNPDKHRIHGVKPAQWNGKEIKEIPGLTRPYAFVNLAGDNIGKGLWTKKKKEKMLNSRVSATQALACFVRSLEFPPETVIQGSAIGFYNNKPTEPANENAEKGKGFLSNLVARWEQAMDLDEDETKHLAFIRTGVVFDPEGGAFPKLIRPVKQFVGGRLGSGHQMISWIHWEDQVRAIEFLLSHPLTGIFNLVAPKPVSQKEFTKAVANAMKRPSFFHIPGWLVRLLAGEKGETLVLKGEHVLPGNLEKSGFRFKYPTLALAIESLI